ncbi:MAG: HDOD domain-containing protein [Deltaproteobacteria bacterium]|nr:HDOD domain-containing protein [Deltaproteobacteria bacterium]
MNRPARTSILDRLGEIRSLPTLPQVVTRVMERVRDEKSSTADIAVIIADDPALTSAVLKVVNSAYYGTAGKDIASVAHAVTRLGIQEVGRICTAVGIARIFGKGSKSIDLAAFWRHSITVAYTTRVLGEYAGGVDRIETDNSYTAGILHDVGTFVLERHFADAFAQTRALMESDRLTGAEAERRLLDITHAEIGGYLLNRWRLPEPVVDAVIYHHEPDLAPDRNRRLAELVHIADFICNNLGVTSTPELIRETSSIAAWDDLALRMEDVPDIIRDVQEEAKRSEVFAALAA